VLRSSFSEGHILLDCKPKELLQEILELGLSAVFPNITITLRIFVSLPAAVVSGERTLCVETGRGGLSLCEALGKSLSCLCLKPPLETG
jgi:hypothetical protein